MIIKRRLICLFACLYLCLFLSNDAFASAPDLSRDVQLTIDYHSADTVLPGAFFNLYKVAEVSSSVHFTLTESFKNASVSFDQIADQSSWREIASTLESYAAQNGIEPSIATETNDLGVSTLSLSSGLYLISGTETELNGMQYKPETTLLMLPGKAADQSWMYDVTIYPKPEIVPIPKLTLQAIKIWNDSQNISLRPTYIEVELFCDDLLSQTVILSKENAWSYTWKELDGRRQWSVREKDVPDGYSSNVERFGDRYIITNSLVSQPSSPGENLPQTGLIWWPVPVLALAGMGLFLAGWLKQRREK